MALAMTLALVEVVVALAMALDLLAVEVVLAMALVEVNVLMATWCNCHPNCDQPNCDHPNW